MPQPLDSYRLRVGATVKRLLEASREAASNALVWYREQVLWKRIAIPLLGMQGLVSVILMAKYHTKLLHLLVSVSEQWRDLKYGGVLLFGLLFICGFPPLFGFATLATLSGTIYGFPTGWYILASSTTIGSLCSFLVFRYFLTSQADRLMNSSERFKALAEILNEESSLYLLTLIRVCPLPYSLLNGALALIPGLSVTTYFLASFISSPRLLLYTYIGHKMKQLGDDSRLTQTKIVDLLSIFGVDIVTVVTVYLIYVKMKAKLKGYRDAQLEDIEIDDVLRNLNDGLSGDGSFNVDSPSNGDNPNEVDTFNDEYVLESDKDSNEDNSNEADEASDERARLVSS